MPTPRLHFFSLTILFGSLINCADDTSQFGPTAGWFVSYKWSAAYPGFAQDVVSCAATSGWTPQRLFQNCLTCLLRWDCRFLGKEMRNNIKPTTGELRLFDTDRQKSVALHRFGTYKSLLEGAPKSSPLQKP